jgi:tetraacyldisaccharide 4'-kinase
MTPFAALYAIVLAARHLLYNFGILRSYSFDFPVICVGNLAVGGTGKTPHTLMIANLLQKKNISVIAIISRGYKRKSKGFQYVKIDDTTNIAGDEPLLMKRRMPNVIVAVCKNRIYAINRIRTDFPDVQAIILDDAFQYRKLNAGLKLLLTSYKRLPSHDFLLPIGGLRDLRSRRQYADVVIVTQCPSTMYPIEHNVLLKNLKLFPYQRSYCTLYRYLQLVSLSTNNEVKIMPNTIVIALAGIANANAFLAHINKTFNVQQTLLFRDHHHFGKCSLQKIKRALQKYPDSIIITTEKDAMRLLHCGLSTSELNRIVYQPIAVEFLRDDEINFSQLLLQYVQTNKSPSTFC